MNRDVPETRLQVIVGPVEGLEVAAQSGDGAEFFKNQRMLQSATNVPDGPGLARIPFRPAQALMENFNQVANIAFHVVSL